MRPVLLVLLMGGCAPPDRWPAAQAACVEGFSAGCQQVLAEHVGGVGLTGLPRAGLLEGMWRLVGADLGPTCPTEWAPVGEAGAGCVYNALVDAVRVSRYQAEPLYLRLAEEGTLLVGEEMGYLHPLYVSIDLAAEVAGPCAARWLGEEGLRRCEGEDCAAWYAAREERSEGCPP